MLSNNIISFLVYSKDHDHSKSSIETLSNRLKEFDTFLESRHILSLQAIGYETLCEYVTGGSPSIHVKKARVWTMHQFFRYLKTMGAIQANPAQKLPYPRVKKKEPVFLTSEELCSVVTFFLSRIDSPFGMRNLIIVLFLTFLGLRASELAAINIQDVDLENSRITVTGKGGKMRSLPLPQILCRFLYPYMKSLEIELGPLFLSNQNKRISSRVGQRIISELSEIGFQITCHSFRHTAATQISQVAGIDITKSILGHKLRETTEHYTHLNPNIYVNYMLRHPFMSPEDQEV